MRIRSLFLSLAAVLVPSAALGQTYINTVTPGAFQPIATIPGITGVTTHTFTSADDGQAVVPLPFTFNFLGSNSTSVNFGSNGYMTFTGDSASSLSNTTLGGTGTPNNFLAFMWDDLLHTSTANVRSGVIGTAPNRIFVIEAGPADRFSGSSGTLFYQVWLYEGPSGRFEWRVTGTVSNTLSATIGYEGAAGQPNYSPFTCGTSCSATELAAMQGQVYATFIADDPELTGNFGTPWPRGALPGGTLMGPVQLRNQGLDPATNVGVSLHLSLDDTYDAATDPQVGTLTVPSLPGGNTPVSRTATITIPAGTAAGEYRLIMRVDPANAYTEANETDNTIVSTFRIATSYDLATTAATAPAGGNPGDPASFSVTLANMGVPYTGNLAMEIYASRDQIFDRTDTVVFSGTRALNGDASQVVQVDTVLPNLMPGTYYIVVVLDPANAIAETNEQNNTFTSANTFPTGPDFSISSLTIPAQAMPGSQFAVSTVVASNAVPYTGAVAYRLYISANSTLEPADPVLGNFTVNFAGQGSLTSQQNVTMPAALAPGSYTIFAVVDPAGAIAELDETNNQRASGGTILNGYDFRVAGVTVSSTSEPGADITVTAQIQSVGLTFNGNLPYRILLSPDTTLDPADLPIYDGQIFIAGLTNTNLNLTFALPSDTLIRSFHAIVQVDPDNVFPETNEMNNWAASPGQLNVRGADLVASSIVGSDVAFMGDDYRVQVTIANEGQAVARGFRWAIYLSENDVIRVTDTQLYVSPTATIAVGGSETFTADIPIPTFTSTRTMYLGVIVDIFSAVPELREGNNVRALPFGVRLLFPIPDLSGGIIETATAAAAGETFAITRILRNEGVADAPSFTYAYYLSSNPTIATDDILLGSYTSSLQEGADDFGIDILTIPSGVPSGRYYVGMLIDPQGQLEEIRTENNRVLGPQIEVYSASIRFVTDRLPNGVVGIPYEVGIYAVGGAVARTWSISGGALPPGLMLNSTTGIISGTPGGEGLFTFTVRASAGTAYAERAYQLRITTPTVQLAIASPTLPIAVVGRPYEIELIAVGGVPPYTWSIASTELPGLSISESGVLSGTPTAPGNLSVTFRVRDAVGNVATRPLALNIISASQSVVIQQQALRVAVLGSEYCDPDIVAFSAMNGVPPYTWSLVGSGVPGLTLNATDGSLCGVPTQAGDFPILIRVQDQSGQLDTSLFIIEVDPGTELAISTPSLPSGEVNKDYTAKLEAVRGMQPYMWEIVDDALPPGLTLDEAGNITGKPTAAGLFVFLVQVTDAQLRVDVRPLSIEVLAAPETDGPDEDSEGCGCSTAPSTPKTGTSLLVGAGLMGLLLARRRRALSLLAVTAAVGVMALGGRAQAQTVPGTQYRMTISDAPYVSYGAAGTNIMGAGSDENEVSVPLPFSFLFYNQPTSSVQVAANGPLVFDFTGSVTLSNAVPGSSATPNGYISGFWDDLHIGSGANGRIFYVVEGTAPSRTITFEFQNIDRFSGANPDMNWQVRLFEGPAGRMQINYGPVGTGATLSGTMAMEDFSGARPINWGPGGCTSSCSLADVASMTNRRVEILWDPGIELVANEVSVPEFGYRGAQMDVTVSLASIHGAAIGPFRYAIELSRTQDFANPVRIFTSQDVTFSPFASQTVTVQATPPANLPEGEYYAALVVDSGNAINEVDENNNRAISSTRVRILEGRPDLAVRRVSADATSLRAGDSLTLYGTVTNVGSDPVMQAMVSLMLSSNPVISPQDLELGTLRVDLAPGQTVTTTLTVTLPADIASGAYYAGFIIDPANMVDELSESNNSLSTFTPISVTGGSLTVATTALPAAVLNQTYLALLTAIGGESRYTWALTSGRLPQGLRLEAGSGEIFGRPAMVESQTFTVEVTSGNQSASAMITLSVTDPTAPLTIVTRALPTAIVGQEYDFELVGIGGNAAAGYTWMASNLPAGVSTSTSGRIFGVPEMAGSATVSITLSDGAAMVTQELTLEIVENARLLIDPIQLPTAQLGEAYSVQLTARGGLPPVIWTIENGTLPAGVRLMSDGTIAGTPEQVGTFRIVVLARDSGGGGVAASDRNTFELVVEDAGGFSISTDSLPVAYVNESYDVTVETTGGEAPFTWRITRGRLPAGINSEVAPQTGNFRILGTPNEIDTTEILLEVTDGVGRVALKPLALQVIARPVEVVDPGEEDGDGCSCSTTASTTGSAAWPLVLGLAGVLVLRRRRQR